MSRQSNQGRRNPVERPYRRGGGRESRRGRHNNNGRRTDRNVSERPYYSVITAGDVMSNLRSFFMFVLAELRHGFNGHLLRQICYYITSLREPASEHHCLAFLFAEVRDLFRVLTGGLLQDFIYRMHSQTLLYVGETLMRRRHDNDRDRRPYDPNNRITNHRFQLYENLVSTIHFSDVFRRERLYVLDLLFPF